MRMKWFSIIFFFAFSSQSVAEEKDYKICNVGGYFSGTGDKFLSGLAAHIAQKKNILSDPICSALWENAHRMGEKLSKTGKIKEQAEGEIAQQAAAFSEKVYEAVSAGIHF